MRPLLLALVLALVVPGVASADFTHFPGSPLAAGGQPFAVTTADFNGDARTDVAIANEGTDSVTVLLRQANGTYTAEAGSPFAAGDGPVSVAAEDFSGDGRPDLAVANFGGGTVTILRRQAAGGFAPEAGSPIAAGQQPSSVASGDFDLDGRPDLAVTNQNAGTVTVYLRQAAGGFAQEGEPLETGTYPHEVVVAQLDSNFGPDLAVSNQSSGTVAILLRQTGGGFAPAAGSPIAVGETPLGLAATDFDGDDDPDLAVANGGSDTISVLFNQPLGFAPGLTLNAGDQPYGLAAGDFDRDGRADLAVSHSRDSTIGVWLRTDTGFTQGYGSPIRDVFNPLRLTAADLDRDGRVDLAIPNHAADTVALLRNVRGTRITSGPDGFTTDTTPTFTFESDDPDASFECALDGGAFAACDTPFTTEALPDGPHEFAVRAIGDPSPAKRAFTVDTTPPETTITSGPDGIVTTTPSYGFDSSEAGSRFECRVVAAPFTACDPPALAAVAGPGAYEFQVRAIDPAGNIDPSPAARAFELRPPLPAGQPPRNTDLPVIRSGPVARVYTCTPGQWDNVGVNQVYEYQWYRAYSFGPHVLVGTGSSYTVPPAYVGYTFYCVVTARNAFGAGSATSAWTVLSGLPSSPVVLVGSAYGNVAVRGIDVFQTVQPISDAKMYGFPSGAFPWLAGGGTPTNYRPGGSLVGPRQRVPYMGVSLDADKPATAIVYVNMTAAAAASKTVKLEVTLRALRGGSVIGTQTRTIADPPLSTSPWVTTAERDNTRFGVQFPLSAFVLNGGELDFEATVGFTKADAAVGRRECDAQGCGADNTFRLDGVPVFRLPTLTVLGVELYGKGQPNGIPTGKVDPISGKVEYYNADMVLTKARQLWPGGERMLIPTMARLDVGDEENYQLSDDQCDDIDATSVRSCRSYYLTQRTLAWRTDDPVAKGAAPYQATFGFFSYPGEPGWTSTSCCPTWATFDPHFGASPLFFADAGPLNRPLTAAAHELGHVFSAPHAERDTNPDPAVDTACGGDSGGQVGEDWPLDNRGRLQGVRFDRTASAPVDPVIDGAGTPWFDLMSYCAPESQAWLSARNWNRAFQTLLDLGARMKAPAARRLAAAQAPARSAFAVGVIGPGGGRITRVVAPDGVDAVPASVPSSPVRLRALDASGAVLADAGVTVTGSTETPAGEGAFVGPVPAGAAAVELVRDGAVLFTLRRSAAPRVRSVAPARSGGSLVVRWSASDPDGGPLTATVEYSTDGGRSWRTVFEGPNRGRAALAGTWLAGSKRARVRVTVSDGFSEASAVSPTFSAAGTASPVRIVSAGPAVPGERFTLVGRALGGRLTWYAGARRLGTGERLTVRLPAGRVVIRLVAGAGEARTTLRVTPAPLRVLDLTAPPRIKRDATRMTVRIRVSAATTFTAAGRTTRLRAGANRVTVPLPRRPARGVLRVPFKVGTFASEFVVTRA